MKEEELQHQDHIRRKLSLRRQIEEGWKPKKMLLLTKIGEEVKREARIEEQRHKLWEEAHRKKQALLEKKIAYHLQKMQKDDLKREGPGGSINENKGQDKREAEVYVYCHLPLPSSEAQPRKIMSTLTASPA
uniref:Uncharacterized protein n=1 Tax=Felis catus TaxID=9685 RepID=A0ABI7W2X1_FELCA